LQFNGNANTVLTGNGTFANFSSISPWVQSGSNISYTAGNVGIGTSGPLLYPLVVQGTALFNGNIFAQNISASSSINVGTFRIVNGIIDSFVSSATQMQMVTNNLGVTSSITAGTTMTAGSTGPTAIKIDGTSATISSPSGNVGFGNNNITTTGSISTNNLITGAFTTDSMVTRRILPFPGDSEVMIGDGAFHFLVSGTYKGDIVYATTTLPPQFNLGIGLSNKFIGTTSYSVIAGCNNAASADYTVTLGNGLTNSIANSIMLGINNPALTIISNNNIGIGTSTPGALLDIEQGVTPTTAMIIQTQNTNSYGYGVLVAVNSANNTLKALTVTDPVNGDKFIVNANGNTSITGQVVIGDQTVPTPAPYNLFVSGGILTEQVQVALKANWPDYVLDKKYPILPIKELEQYISKNKHLPDVPSASEIEKNGVNLGDMDAKLLKKIEELTLYIIKQQQESEQLKNEVKDLEERVKSINKSQHK
jgi:hypothetical protein